MKVIPVILCGGSGTRLWPLSNQKVPKQFLSLISEKTLFQETLLRFSKRQEFSSPIIIGNKKFKDLLKQQLAEIDLSPLAMMFEPCGRNTAPAIAMAAFFTAQKQDDAVLLVLPSDHVIARPDLFLEAVDAAMPYAIKGDLMTFGIVPTHPETGYGYIKKGSLLNNSDAYRVDQFVEKPDIETAKKYLISKNYLWNSGMFMFTASRYLDEMKAQNQKLFTACEKAFNHALIEQSDYNIQEELFLQCENISVDYAIMEKTQQASVIPLDAGWSDIGTWDALLDVCPKDENGNASLGHVILDHVKNSYIRSGKKNTIIIGLNDVVIVDTDEALLVAHKDSASVLKKIVEEKL